MSRGLEKKHSLKKSDRMERINLCFFFSPVRLSEFMYHEKAHLLDKPLRDKNQFNRWYRNLVPLSDITAGEKKSNHTEIRTGSRDPGAVRWKHNHQNHHTQHTELFIHTTTCPLPHHVNKRIGGSSPVFALHWRCPHPHCVSVTNYCNFHLVYISPGWTCTCPRCRRVWVNLRRYFYTCSTWRYDGIY